MSLPSLPPAVPVTSLRVFEPVQVYPAAQRARWRAQLVRGDSGARAAEAERRESWRRVLRGARDRSPVTRPGAEGGPRAEGDGDGALAGHARVLWADGALLLCPASLGGGGGPRRTLVRAWSLPVPWLIVVGLSAVEDAEPAPAPGRYLTSMARARSQAARALRTSRLAPVAEEVALELEVLARWLEGFHPRSWLELDARPVAALVGGDDGIDDVRLGMECLTSGDADGAAAAYQRLRRRSRALTGISRLS